MTTRRFFLLGTIVGLVIGELIIVLFRNEGQQPEIEQSRALISVSYEKPDELIVENSEFDGVEDPWPDLTVMEGVVLLASQCAVSGFSFMDNAGLTHQNSIAQIHIVLDTISPESFECLAAAVAPPFVTMSKGEENCAPRDPEEFFDWPPPDFKETQSLCMKDIS